MQHDTVTVEQFYREHADALQMKLVAGAANLKRIIREPTVNRPGLALSGFTHYFAYKRVQVMGNAEVYYLRSLSAERSARRVTPICSPTKFRASSSAAVSGRTRNFWRRRRRRGCRFSKARW